MPGWVTGEHAFDAATLLIAVYGAALSSLVYRRDGQKDQRAVLVRLSSFAPVWYGQGVGANMAKVEAVNTGHRPVTVTYLTLRLPNLHTLASLSSGVPGMPDTALPAVLNDGDIAHKSWSYSDIGHALLGAGYRQDVLLTPVATDSTGRKYIGEAWSVSPTEFADM